MATQTTRTTERIFTRAEHVRGKKVSHADYYRQFVTADTISVVRNAFGEEALTKALQEDLHLNSIPLARWDALTTREAESTPKWAPAGARTGGFYATLPINRANIEAAGETVTRSTLLCIAKQAARMVVARHWRATHPETDYTAD